jgi:ferredoxin
MCPEIYDWDDEGKAEVVDEVSNNLEECAQEALESCPVEAIKNI